MNKLLLKSSIYLILIMNLSFFYLIHIPSFIMIGNYQKMGIVLLGIIITVLFHRILIKENKKYLFAINILFLFFLYLCEVVLSKISYTQNIKDILSASSSYLILGLYFIVAYYTSKYSKQEQIEEFLITCILLASMLMITQYIIYEYTGFIFLNIGKAVRYDSLRIYESDYFFVFGSVLALGMLLNDTSNKKNKYKYMLAVILSAIEIIVVSKSRTGIIMSVISCMFITFLHYKSKRLKLLNVFLIFILLITLGMKVPFINKAITSINQNDSSINVRIEAGDFYLKQIANNPIYGVGFIKPIPNDKSYSLVRGDKGLFYKSDMGILGSINSMGVVFLFWYLFLVYKIIKILFILYKRNQYSKNLEIFGVAFLSLSGSLAMNPFDPQRVVLFPFILASIDYAYYNN